MSQLKVGLLLDGADIRGLLKMIGERMGQIEAEQRATGRQNHAAELAWLKGMRHRLLVIIGAKQPASPPSSTDVEEAEFSASQSKS